jgi:predicted RND superfamily exporter protein/lauroyl/myristoyl acyltransferase
MTRRFRIWPWLLLGFALAVAGWTRLHFDVEVLNLLPDEAPAVKGLKIFQQHFANARELIVTVTAPEAEQAEAAAHSLADRLHQATNLVADVTWQPPWLENPGQSAELIAYLWFNQPPETFRSLTNRFAPEQIARTLTEAREQLASSLSPGDVARLSYDPLGLTQLPAGASGGAPAFGQGQELFSSSDGTFRILFVESAHDLTTYRDCTKWLQSVKEIVQALRAENQIPAAVNVQFTGRPAFVAEISSGMQHDMIISVGGTSLIIAALFWLAHRRWKPMLWLLTLLALILAGTLGLGGLIFGTVNVVSMGFAAILLGLAVDYAVVHYQEALAQPELSVPEIRRAIAPSIFWAAVTTICAFLVLNFGGLPGLAQLGSLVGVGVALSAVVMIFAFLPPLFPDRMQPARSSVPPVAAGGSATAGTELRTSSFDPRRTGVVFTTTAILICAFAAILIRGLPKMDATANALRPRSSPAYAALEAVKQQLAVKREPLWLLVGGRNENEVATRIAEVEPALNQAVSNGVLTEFTLPSSLWPRPEFQNANRTLARQLSSRKDELRAAVSSQGFTPTSLALTEGILDTWRRAGETTAAFWPTNRMSRWIFERFVARNSTNYFALALLTPAASTGATSERTLASLRAALPKENVWLSGWELLGDAIFASVRNNLWKLVLPMAALILLSLGLAFRRPTEVLLSLAVLFLSGICLLALMQLFGWSWNLLNLMALPLIMGTGVDYSIFMQLALRRHHGDLRLAHRSVGRALLLCGGTAVSGFGALAFSSNAGMASLGEVCAVGIAGNMLISVFLLPSWWSGLTSRVSKLQGREQDKRSPTVVSDFNPSTLDPRPSTPSSLYRAELWRAGLWIVRLLPRRLCVLLGRGLAEIYRRANARRRETVIENLLPVLENDRTAAERTAKALFREFAIKIVDLWRYEAGLPIQNSFGLATGWERLARAQAEGRGVLLLTPHLGNWEFGGPWLTQKGIPLQVITLAEPGKKLTQLRSTSRARWNIETLVIGNDPFGAVEIVRRLGEGATVALLIDRPPHYSAVTVELFGRPFAASVAAAELARASGCILLPVYLPRTGDAYAAHVLPPIAYDRAALRDRAARLRLTQEIVRAFEPVIRQHPDQWYHFVPIWPR